MLDSQFASEGRVLNLLIVSDSERYLNVFNLRAKRALFLKCFKRQAAAWGRSVLVDRAQRRLARFSNGSILDLGGVGLKIFSPPPLIYFLYWDPDPDPEKNQKPIRARGGACALIADRLKNLFGPSKNFGCLIPESILKTILKP